jgi:hypothetical protein
MNPRFKCVSLISLILIYNCIGIDENFKMNILDQITNSIRNSLKQSIKSPYSEIYKERQSNINSRPDFVKSHMIS